MHFLNLLPAVPFLAGIAQALPEARPDMVVTAAAAAPSCDPTTNKCLGWLEDNDYPNGQTVQKSAWAQNFCLGVLANTKTITQHSTTTVYTTQTIINQVISTYNPVVPGFPAIKRREEIEARAPAAAVITAAPAPVAKRQAPVGRWWDCPWQGPDSGHHVCNVQNVFAACRCLLQKDGVAFPVTTIMVIGSPVTVTVTSTATSVQPVATVSDGDCTIGYPEQYVLVQKPQDNDGPSIYNSEITEVKELPWVTSEVQCCQECQLGCVLSRWGTSDSLPIAPAPPKKRQTINGNYGPPPVLCRHVVVKQDAPVAGAHTNTCPNGYVNYAFQGAVPGIPPPTFIKQDPNNPNNIYGLSLIFRGPCGY